MTTPIEIYSGHGPVFVRNEDYVGYEDRGDVVAMAYEGRVTWADSDHWEYPDWVYSFMDKLKAEYKAGFKVWSRKGDKGYMTIFFSERA